MVAGVPLIDLDRPAPAPAEPPAAVRSRPVALAVLVAALLTLGGAAPAPPGLTPVLSLAESYTAFRPDAGSFFLATRTHVRRHELTRGAVRWQVPFDRLAQDLRLDESAGVLLVMSGRGPRMTALDAATGRQLWTAEAPDTLVVSTSGGTVLTRTSGGDGAWLRLADVRTGREIWARQVDPAGFLGPDTLYGAGSPRIVVVDSSGDVLVLRYADGAVLSRGDLGLGHGPAAASAVSVVGERLYVSRRVRGRAVLTAYGLTPLIRLWQAEGGPVGTVTDCGPVLCVADTRWVTAVDPAGGATRWAQPSWSIAYRFDAHRLFAYDNQEQTEAALLDAATGRVLQRLGQSRQLDGGLVLRAEGRQTLVLVAEGESGGLRTAGVVPDAAWFRCEARADLLVCPTLTGELGLWRVR
jgi:outer membrane protein assembly factor BamB